MNDDSTSSISMETVNEMLDRMLEELTGTNAQSPDRPSEPESSKVRSTEKAPAQADPSDNDIWQPVYEAIDAAYASDSSERSSVNDDRAGAPAKAALTERERIELRRKEIVEGQTKKIKNIQRLDELEGYIKQLGEEAEEIETNFNKVAKERETLMTALNNAKRSSIEDIDDAQSAVERQFPSYLEAKASRDAITNIRAVVEARRRKIDPMLIEQEKKRRSIVEKINALDSESFNQYRSNFYAQQDRLNKDEAESSRRVRFLIEKIKIYEDLQEGVAEQEREVNRQREALKDRLPSIDTSGFTFRDLTKKERQALEEEKALDSGAERLKKERFRLKGTLEYLGKLLEIEASARRMYGVKLSILGSAQEALVKKEASILKEQFRSEIIVIVMQKFSSSQAVDGYLKELQTRREKLIQLDERLDLKVSRGAFMLGNAAVKEEDVLAKLRMLARQEATLENQLASLKGKENEAPSQSAQSSGFFASFRNPEKKQRKEQEALLAGKARVESELSEVEKKKGEEEDNLKISDGVKKTIREETRAAEAEKQKTLSEISVINETMGIIQKKQAAIEARRNVLDVTRFPAGVNGVLFDVLQKSVIIGKELPGRGDMKWEVPVSEETLQEIKALAKEFPQTPGKRMPLSIEFIGAHNVKSQVKEYKPSEFKVFFGEALASKIKKEKEEALESQVTTSKARSNENLRRK